MELPIDFECPECRKVQPRHVAELSPGSRDACLACGADTELTVGALKAFRRRLRELCEEQTSAAKALPAACSEAVAAELHLDD